MTQDTSSGQTWLSRLTLRRIITSNRFIPELDGFRFLAILIVVLAHVGTQCSPFAAGTVSRVVSAAVGSGLHGVCLFFTISGFILALPFARHHLQQGNRVNLLHYFRRRLTRLEPPYILAMFLRVPLVLLYKHTPISVLAVHLLATLLYTHNVIYGVSSSINPPAWSLEIEVQFYILAPFLTALFLISNKLVRRSVLVALILLNGLLAYYFIPANGRLELSLLNYGHFFLSGFLLCDIYLCNDHMSLPRWIWDVVGLAALTWIFFSRANWYPVAMPFVTLVLYMAGFYGIVWRAIFSFPPVSLIGGMCYSLYLTHTTVLTGMASIAHRIARSHLPPGLQFPIIASLCCAAILAVGTGYFLLIERPCMDPAWPQKLRQRLGWGS